MWFLDHHCKKGVVHHFYILADVNLVQNLEVIVDNIGQFWNENITNGLGSYLAFHRYGGYKEHRSLGTGIVSRTDWESMQRFFHGIRFMCVREMYRRLHDTLLLESFNKGTFRSKKKASRNTTKPAIGDLNMTNNIRVTPVEHLTWKGSPILNSNVLLGYETFTGQPVRWQPGKLNNGFLLVTGQSGSGKTNTLKQVCYQLSSKVPVWVLDPHDALNDLGFTPIVLSGGAKCTHGINPMMLYFEDFAKRGMHDQVLALVDVIRRASRNFGRRSEDVLQLALLEAYKRMGFSVENPSPECQPPTFELVVKILDEWFELEGRKGSRNSIEGCLSVLRTVFGHPVFSQKDYFDIEKNQKECIHFDLSALSESVRFVVVESLLRQMFNYLSQVGPIQKSAANDSEMFRLFIVIDEAKLLTMTGGDPEAPNRILNILISEGRKFGIGLVLASQRFDHFSKEIRANAAARLIHKTLDGKEAKLQAEQMQIPPKMLMNLEGKGDSFFWDGSTRPLRVNVTEYFPTFLRRKLSI